MPHHHHLQLDKEHCGFSIQKNYRQYFCEGVETYIHKTIQGVSNLRIYELKIWGKGEERKKRGRKKNQPVRQLLPRTETIAGRQSFSLSAFGGFEILLTAR